MDNGHPLPCGRPRQIMAKTQSANPRGLQHGSKSTTPHLLPELTVTIVAMLNTLSTPHDLLGSPL
jgi:hypothetical protein